MLKISCSIFFILNMNCVFAQDSNHIRFWRGYKQDHISYEKFLKNISTTLIPMTIEVGGQKGLNAYLPSILPEKKEIFLPDEIALLTYENLQIYTQLTKSPEWEAYGPLHYADGYFAKEARGKKSGSLVVSNEFPKDLSKPFAYKISQIDGAFMTYENKISFFVFQNIDRKGQESCLRKLDEYLRNEDKDALSSVIMYDIDYVALMQTRLSQNEGVTLKLNSCFKLAHESNYVKDIKILNVPSSVNFQF